MDGEFLTRDATGFHGDTGNDGNPIAYCGNNPRNRVDPTGQTALVTSMARLAVLATVAVSFQKMATTEMRAGQGQMTSRRLSFYACNGMSRAITKLAQDYLVATPPKANGCWNSSTNGMFFNGYKPCAITFPCFNIDACVTFPCYGYGLLEQEGIYFLGLEQDGIHRFTESATFGTDGTYCPLYATSPLGLFENGNWRFTSPTPTGIQCGTNTGNEVVGPSHPTSIQCGTSIGNGLLLPTVNGIQCGTSTGNGLLLPTVNGIQCGTSTGNGLLLPTVHQISCGANTGNGLLLPAVQQARESASFQGGCGSDGLPLIINLSVGWNPYISQDENSSCWIRSSQPMPQPQPASLLLPAVQKARAR